AHSQTATLTPCSRAASAAHIAALPPPTTTTSNSLIATLVSFLVLRLLFCARQPDLVQYGQDILAEPGRVFAHREMTKLLHDHNLDVALDRLRCSLCVFR